MANYYGVQRSEEYLAHYGIKGMRWGVQKAKVAGNDKQLTKHFMKAQKKLEKLNQRADSTLQSLKADKYANRAKLAGADTVAGAGYTMFRVGQGYLSPLGLGVMAQGLGRTAYNGAKSMYHKRKATASGHLKAQRKRDAWQKEMNEAFKGTKYGKKTYSGSTAKKPKLNTKNRR